MTRISSLVLAASLHVLFATAGSRVPHSVIDQTAQTLRAIVWDNPYAYGRLYLNRLYRKQLESSFRTGTEAEKDALSQVVGTPTALWLDTIETVEGDGNDSLSVVLKDASHYRAPPLVTFVVHNLPNRDCGGEAIAGEICCSPNEDGTSEFLDTSNRCDNI